MSWVLAYARQAQSDLDARDCLLSAATRLPRCHELHFLQMGIEKLCKAHLLESGSSTASHVRTSHAYIANPLRVIVKQMLARQPGAATDGWLFHAISELGRKIELFAPAVDDGGRVPANCEYPWITADGAVVAPVDHDFGLDLLYERAGITLLKLARVRLREILADTGPGAGGDP